MHTLKIGKCPLCGGPCKQTKYDYSRKTYFYCPKCGEFGISDLSMDGVKGREGEIKDRIRDTTNKPSVIVEVSRDNGVCEIPRSRHQDIPETTPD